METKAAYHATHIAALIDEYTAKWGTQAYFEYAHVGGRGTVPTITDRNGRGVILRRTQKGYVECRTTQ